MIQQMLPLALKCVNPQCNERAQRNDWFCSMDCYERVRILGLSRRIIDRTAMIVALVATAALGVTAIFP